MKGAGVFKAVMNRSHPDLRIVHSIPGRIRLKARKLHGRRQFAEDVSRKLSAVHGLHRVEANPTTGSLTMHYHRSALDSAAFFSELAAALGLIAEGIDPESVEALFDVIGTSPAELITSLDKQHVLLSLAMFGAGLYIGRHWV
jgi:hypothetical protein